MTDVLCDAIAPEIRRDVEARFDTIEAEQGVRFLYARRRDCYLGLRAGCDVIERPLADAILPRWDTEKALGLLLEGNAGLADWLASPSRYRADREIVTQWQALADAVLDGRAITHHYARLGLNAAAQWLERDSQVPVKTYFYALRPALVPAPQSGGAAAEGAASAIDLGDLPEQIAWDIVVPVEAKRQTNERLNGARIQGAAGGWPIATRQGASASRR
jgi:hypothetical protein